MFENAVKVKDAKIDIESIQSVLDDPRVKDNTNIGFVNGAFDNSQEIKDKLNAVTVAKFMIDLKKKVAEYYEGN